ncbi:trypsin-1 isoform X2 [Aethina tumida]|uniref:trypsin-1 isoform X2 n=1 Tax=Aethina tumida TaxID=116153 RepID=UPI00096B3994|nr:trypsin-1 isoform X2 [Aethina tumida]
MGFKLHLLPSVIVFFLIFSISLTQDCGRSVRRSRQPRYGSLGRIIHGKQSVRGAWPWQVSLQLLHPQFGFLGHWCGGVMISNEWLLTAAHCINNDLFNLPLPALWTAVLGDWDRNVEEHSEERIPVEEIILHERFHNFQHDIALVKLSRPVKLVGESRIRAVCLPNKRLTYNDTGMCIATGWGRDAENGILAGKLLETKVPVHDNAICRKKYGHSVNIRSGHLCAGHLDGSTGTCVGDSGGPLQCAMSDGRWILAGITSFGSGCAKPGFPDVYTKLSYYMPWIKAKTSIVPRP